MAHSSPTEASPRELSGDGFAGDPRRRDEESTKQTAGNSVKVQRVDSAPGGAYRDAADREQHSLQANESQPRSEPEIHRHPFGHGSVVDETRDGAKNDRFPDRGASEREHHEGNTHKQQRPDSGLREREARDECAESCLNESEDEGFHWFSLFARALRNRRRYPDE